MTAIEIAYKLVGMFIATGLYKRNGRTVKAYQCFRHNYNPTQLRNHIHRYHYTLHILLRQGICLRKGFLRSKLGLPYTRVESKVSVRRQHQQRNILGGIGVKAPQLGLQIRQ